MEQCEVITYALKRLRFDFNFDKFLECFDLASLSVCEELIYHLIPTHTKHLSKLRIPKSLVNELILYGEDEIFLQQEGFNLIEAIYFVIILDKMTLFKELVNEIMADFALSICIYAHRYEMITHLQEQYPYLSTINKTDCPQISKLLSLPLIDFDVTLTRIIICRKDDLFRAYLQEDLSVFDERRPVKTAIFPYLRHNNVSLMEYVIAYRYTSGLKIMIDLGCPINFNSFHLAYQIKDVEILKLILLNAEDLPKFNESFILRYLSKSDFNLYCRFLN